MSPSGPNHYEWKGGRIVDERGDHRRARSAQDEAEGADAMTDAKQQAREALIAAFDGHRSRSRNSPFLMDAMDAYNAARAAPLQPEAPARPAAAQGPVAELIAAAERVLEVAHWAAFSRTARVGDGAMRELHTAVRAAKREAQSWDAAPALAALQEPEDGPCVT